MTTRVVNIKTAPFYDVYIGRSSPFGNKFSHRSGTLAQYRVKTREEAIAKYEEWIYTQPELIEKVKKELKNRILGCFCSPLKCHGDILAKIANE